MQALRSQFFIAFAVTGSLIPFLTVVFKEEQGLGEEQIGIILAVSQLSILLTPVLLTLVADARRNNRGLVVGIFALCALAQAGLWAFTGFWATMLLFLLHSLAFAPMLPLQDGLYFTARRQAEIGRRTAPPYHRIRLMGTIGFIVPSILLYLLLQGGGSLKLVFHVATFFCLIGIINAWRLPRLAAPSPQAEAAGGSRLPTLEAGRVLLRPPAVFFCAGLGLTHFAGSAYYGFYPLYLTEVAGVDRQWLGLIANIGVLVEVGFMAAFGLLSKRLGLRTIVVLGMGAMFCRMLLLASFPGMATALGIQFFHGIIIIATHVAPILILNSLAGDTFRNSIQGLFTLVFIGVPRITGSLLSGYLAAVSLQLTFAVAALMCFAGLCLIWFAFRDRGFAGTAP